MRQNETSFIFKWRKEKYTYMSDKFPKSKAPMKSPTIYMELPTEFNTLRSHTSWN